MLRIALVTASVFLLAFFTSDDAYAHGVSGGFSPRQPDMILGLPMLAAASFGILAVLVRRIRMIIGIALVTGSLIGFVLTNFELTRLGYQTEGFTDQTRLYYGVLQYSLGVFLVSIIGGLVVIAYYMVARYPLRKRLRG